MGRVLIIVVMLWCSGGLAQAVDIQFVLNPGQPDDGNVTGVSDLIPMEPVAGRGIITLIGSALDIVWPVPIGQPVNTPCAAGQYDWTRITDPPSVTLAGAGMELRQSLSIFKSTSPLLTSCVLVTSKHHLNTLVDDLIVDAVPDNPTTTALNFHFGWYYGRCGDAPTNQNCLDWKTQLNTMVSRYPGRAQGIDAATKAATLITNANTFLSQQCTAQPGGPFC